MAEERQLIMDGMNEERMAREERAERRIEDAITSPKLGNKTVAEGCLAWLINKGLQSANLKRATLLFWKSQGRILLYNSPHGPRPGSSWIDWEKGSRHDRVLETMESETWVKK